MAARILIVDDTETMRSFEAMILEKDGYKVRQAENGIQALQEIADTTPDIVLLDIEMPSMNGIECCRQIKSNDAFKEIKVIMVTTLSKYPRIREAFKAGADDYVTKPVDANELRSKIKELLKFVELRKLIKS